MVATRKRTHGSTINAYTLMCLVSEREPNDGIRYTGQRALSVRMIV